MKRSVLALVVAALCLAGVPGQVAGARAPAERGGGGTAAGLAGPAITLANQKNLNGYDIAMGSDGTAYVGWIAGSISAADRAVFSCVLPAGATSCLNGIQSTAALGTGTSSADGLQVLPPTGASPATLVWFHDTVDSLSGPLNAKIATATVQPNGALSGATDQAAAYSFGSLLTAERGPGGVIWAVQLKASFNELRVLPGLAGTPKVLTPPAAVAKARLAFASGKAVLVVDRLGGLTEKLRVVRQTTDTDWSSFSAINGTWAYGSSFGGAFDVVAQGGVKLVATKDNASYYPRIASWNGTGFGSWTLTGDKNSCAPTSHDLFPDVSGRFADAALACSKVVIANHPKAKTGAFVRFGVGGSGVSAGGEPQIGTNPRGLGWVAWSRLTTTPGNGNTLLVAPIRLPAQKTSNSTNSTAGKVTVSGPVSCLPAVQTRIGVSANPAAGWSVVSKTLKLDGSVHGTGLNGATLVANSTHTVSGTVKFKKGGQTKTVTAQLSFKACPSP